MQDAQMVTVLSENGKYKILRFDEPKDGYYPLGNYTVHESNTLTTPDGELIAKDEHVINYPVDSLLATQWLIVDTGGRGLMVDERYRTSARPLITASIEGVSENGYSLTIKIDTKLPFESVEGLQEFVGKHVSIGNTVGELGIEEPPKGKAKTKMQPLYAYFHEIPLHQIHKVKDVFVWKA